MSLKIRSECALHQVVWEDDAPSRSPDVDDVDDSDDIDDVDEVDEGTGEDEEEEIIVLGIDRFHHHDTKVGFIHQQLCFIGAGGTS